MTEWNRIDKGAGRPLVLLHGGGSSANSWLPVIDQLAQQRRVIAFDFPGFGDTPAVRDMAFTMDWAMQQLAEQLNLLGIDTPVDIAGNSMGGWMALEAAKRGMARSVVAIGPAGLWAKGMPPLTRIAFAAGIAGSRVAGTRARAIFDSPAVRAATLFAPVKHPRRLTSAEAIGQMVAASSLDDIILTSALTGLPASMLKPSIDRVGIDLGALQRDEADVSAVLAQAGVTSVWRELYSAGHSTSGVSDVPFVADLVERTTKQYFALESGSGDPTP
ncbi:alpha/beta fold hydrolase [Mycobacterium sp. pUA109]|uniref:alpha/beta fold hydrolase n=1 Tax=Mycobacterium sp. pUA109 TaxID=3238982 RepID=UPI00351B1D66